MTLSLLAAAAPGLARPDPPRRSADPPPAHAPAGDPLEFVERLPAGVEAVVLIESAAAQARSGPGRALAAAVREAASLAPMVAAWDRLAATLEWSSERTFDALLGRRAALALSGLQGRPAWVLASVVEPPTAERLRQRLKPAPRGVVENRVVLAVEDGAYELSLIPGAAGDAVTLVLAPARHSGLFDQVVRVAGGGREPRLAGSPAFAAAREIGVGDAFFLYHRDLLAGRKDPGRAAHYLLASAVLREDGWSARLRASPGVLMDRGKAAAVTAWTPRTIEGLSRGAVLLALGLGPAEASRVLRLDALAAALERDTALSRLLAQRWALGVWTGLCGRPDAHDAMTVAVAVETPDADALAVEGDRVMTLLVPLLAGGAPAGEGFGGMYPRAVRTAGGAAAPGRPPGRAVSWTYPLAQSSVIGAGPSAPASDPGWWVVSLTTDGGACAPLGGGETSVRWARDLSTLLTAPDPAEGQPGFLSLGLVRPGALAALLRASGLDDTGTLSAWRWIESVTWKTWLEGEFIEGTVETTVREARDGRGGR